MSSMANSKIHNDGVQYVDQEHDEEEKCAVLIEEETLGGQYCDWNESSIRSRSPSPSKELDGCEAIMEELQSSGTTIVDQTTASIAELKMRSQMVLLSKVAIAVNDIDRQCIKEQMESIKEIEKRALEHRKQMQVRHDQLHQMIKETHESYEEELKCMEKDDARNEKLVALHKEKLPMLKKAVRSNSQRLIGWVSEAKRLGTDVEDVACSVVNASHDAHILQKLCVQLVGLLEDRKGAKNGMFLQGIYGMTKSARMCSLIAGIVCNHLSAQ